MAKISFELDMDGFSALSKSLTGILKMSVYDGAGKVLEAMQNASSAHDRTGGLTDSWGVHKIISGGGSVYTDVSVDGYSDNENGQKVANAIKANALESGTSWNGKKHQKATHCFSKAARSVTNSAIQAMSDRYDEQVNKIFE